MTKVSTEDIHWFNRRIINPDTVDGVLRVCDDLRIPDTIGFIIKFAETDRPYTNLRLPEFMRIHNSSLKYSHINDIIKYRAIQYIDKYIFNHRFRMTACSIAVK